MTKEYAYAYEAGYRAGSTNYELEHCPACKNVADLQDALAENGELRIEADCLCDENECLVSENADLRELVRDMWRFTGAACKKYPKLFDQSAQGGQMVHLNAIDAFEQRMRELGVE